MPSECNYDIRTECILKVWNSQKSLLNMLYASTNLFNVEDHWNRDIVEIWHSWDFCHRRALVDTSRCGALKPWRNKASRLEIATVSRLPPEPTTSKVVITIVVISRGQQPCYGGRKSLPPASEADGRSLTEFVSQWRIKGCTGRKIGAVNGRRKENATVRLAY